MRKIIACLLLICILAAVFSGCTQASVTDELSIESTASDAADKEEAMTSVKNKSETVTEGNENYRGFVVDNILHSDYDGDIHYNVYIPESYDGKIPFALYFTLPGYEGLYGR